MPETFHLQVETRETSGSRVIELPHGSVRVGRSIHCDVVLNDSSLADVECVLRLRGETWYVQPLGARSRVTVDGNPIHHLRILPPGVTIRVGDDRLTIRTTTEPDTVGTFDIPIPVGPSGTFEEPSPHDEDSEDAPRSRPWIARRPRFLARTIPVGSVAPTSTAWNREVPAARSWRDTPQSVHFGEFEPTIEVETAFEPSTTPTSISHSESPDLDQASPIVQDHPSFGVASVLVDVPRPSTLPTLEAEIDFSTLETVVIAPEPDEVFPSDSTRTGVVDPELAPQARVVSIAEVLPEFPASGSQAAWVEGIARTEQVAVIPAQRPELSDQVETEPLVPSEPSVPLAIAGPSHAKRSRRRPTVDRSRASSVEEDMPDLEDLEWPSARVILASVQPSRPSRRDREPVKVETSRSPLPTHAQEPRQWSLPVKWVIVPAAAVLLACSTLGVYLCWEWGNDAHEAGMIADRLLRTKGTGPNGAAEAVVTTDATWWKTTANHLALKAAALGTDSSGEPERAEPIPHLLGAARHASPLEPTTRLARVQADGGSSPLATLGLSRETVNLAVTGRKLAQEGKVEASLRAYRSALELAAGATVDQSQPPVFLSDSTPGRFALPNEETILAVVRDMASQPDWSFEKWSVAVPENPLALLATYRVLKERDLPEAGATLDRVISAPVSDSQAIRSLHLVARAEGLALRSRYTEAADIYRDAIGELEAEPVRRTWWFNLAEILSRDGETSKMADALASARAGRGDDEIGRLVGQAMARDGLGGKPEIASPGIRAN